MPPLLTVGDIPGMEGSSLFLHRRNDEPPSPDLLELSRRTAFSPMEIFRTLNARSEPTKPFNPGQGSIDPHDINMAGLMALFAIIGASFVLGAIWFFFWAKNGGFVWRKGDWEEYKSTVLRRKGVDGRTLSNATPSTKLGGGSVVDSRFRDDDGMTEAGMTTTETAFTVTDEKRQHRQHRRRLREKLLRLRAQEERPWEGPEDEDVRAYREEKPARVGGINREADGTYHGSDCTTHYDQSDVSEARDAPYRDHDDNDRGRDPERDDHHSSSRQTYRDRDHDHGRDRYRDRDRDQDRSDSKPERNRSVSGFSFTAGSEDVLRRTTEEHYLRDPASSRRDSHREHYREHRRAQRRESRRRESERERDSARDRDRDRDRERRHRSSRPPSSRRSSRPSSTARHSRERSSTRRAGAGGGGTGATGHYTEPLDFTSSAPANSEYQFSTVGTESSSHALSKTYLQPLPSLSRGYRRDPGGRRRRRDSLSDSEAEDSRFS